MKLGVHVSGGGKIYEVFDRALALKCNTLQFFARSPVRWRENKLPAADIKEFGIRKKQSGISPVFIHIPYLINLASPDRALYQASIKAYVEDVQEAGKLGVDYIVTHMGSHKETSEAAGLKRLAEALNKIVDKTRDSGVGILLENTSGSGSWLGYKFSHHKKVYELLEDKKRFGICIDTAHAYLAGYNIALKEGLDQLLEDIESAVGLDLIKLIHLNDTRDLLGSHHDRHFHIGKGNIGIDGMRRIINHAKLKDVPFILETPKDNEDSDKVNLSVVRSLSN